MKKIYLNNFKVFLLICFITFAAQSANGQMPVASFSTTKTTGSTPLTVQMENTSANASSYFWNFNNGNTSTLTNPSNTYLNPGVYTIRLTAVGGNQLKDSSFTEKTITVVPNPIAGFQISQSSACLTNNSFSFSNESLHATNYTWDFGDGGTSSIPDPKHSYSSPGTYTVKLLVRNDYGSSDLKTMARCIEVFPMPVAAFNVNTTSSCNLDQPFEFSSSQAVRLWQWDFGDSTTSALQNPKKNYSREGHYSIALTVTDNHGCNDKQTKKNYLFASDKHLPEFTFDKNEGCVPLNVAFSNVSPNVTEWLWDFGDGTTSTLNKPSHTYNNAGIYSVSLKIKNKNKCTYEKSLKDCIKPKKNTVVSNFTVSRNSGCTPLNVILKNTSENAAKWLWDFGDSSFSSLKNPTHAYLKSGKYVIKLYSYNANGCESLYQMPDTIDVSFPKANFETNQIPSCAPYSLNFSNTSKNADKWLWSFGDGDTSSKEKPLHTYLTPGDYTVSLIAINSKGCRDTLSIGSYVRVLNTVANFIPPPTMAGCAPLTAGFSDVTLGAIAWLWEFGDGTTSNQKNPSHTYTQPGFYTVSLTIKMNGGCTQEFPAFRTFEVQKASSAFNFILPECTPPYIADFIDSSANATTWLWDFGDGSAPSALQNPNHIYSKKGPFTVKLTTTIKEGCSNSIIQSNAIYFSECGPPPNPGGTGQPVFLPSPPSDGIVSVPPNVPKESIHFPPIYNCAPLTVGFNNLLKGITSWVWDFGDGYTSTLESPVHIYLTNGKFDVKMEGTYPDGRKETILYPGYINISTPKADFNIISGNSCQNNLISFVDSSKDANSWNWDFGDKTSSSLRHPTHVYSGSSSNFNISLEAKNQLGCSNKISKSIYIGNDIPAIWVSTYTACANEGINYFSSSYNYTTYFWNFGDGTTSTLKEPKHAYIKGGSYLVSLVVTDQKGCVHTFTCPAKIKVYHPVAEFTSATQKSCNSLTVDFTNLSTGTLLPDSKNIWNFGDGHSEGIRNPTHTYSLPGTYLVTLTVFSENNCSSVVSKSIEVYPTLVADFSFTQDKTCLPLKATYSNLSTSNVISWKWEFGDGSVSQEKSPVHTFSTPPLGPVRLSITDGNGCLVSISKTNIRIFKSKFTASATTGCKGLDVAFKNSSSDATSCLWDFGDGTNSTLENPSHKYKNSGIFRVRLLVKNTEGCMDTSVLDITINNIEADFSSPTPSACAPSLVSFNDLSINATKWTWDFGDGTTSGSANPSHIYSIPGNYAIRLIVENNTKCRDTLTKKAYIKVLGPLPFFDASATTGCSELGVQFTDHSTGTISWQWSFGDGYTSELKNPFHEYKNVGNNTVSLIISDSIGCSSVFTLNKVINIFPKPGFFIHSTDMKGCEPYKASFNNLSLHVDSYNWSFGDGSHSTLKSPSHVYANSGTYVPFLVAKNNFGCSDSIKLPAVKVMKPAADFICPKTADCFTSSFSFKDISKDAAKWFWDFGDGTTSALQHPVHTYTPGIYSVQLMVASEFGCMDTLSRINYIHARGPVVGFDAPIKGCPNEQLPFTDRSVNVKSRTWYFGDGTSSLETSPLHAYKYPGEFSVTLKTLDSFGCVSQYKPAKPIVIHPAAKAVITTTDTLGCAPYTVHLKNASKESNIYSWQFGESDVSLLGEPTYTFATKGKYKISLFASNQFGCSDTISRYVHVKPSPVIDFKAFITAGCSPLTTQFSNASGEQVNPRYMWDFGNGQSSIEKNPLVTIKDTGFFPVTLTIHNSNGCSQSASRINYLHVYDLIAPEPSKILTVTVLSNTATSLIWEPSTAIDFDHYTLFRKKFQSLEFEQIATIYSKDVASFKDTAGVDALHNSYCYKIQTTDKCGNSHSPDLLPAHCSINVSARGQDEFIKVSWTPYIGATVHNYKVYRMEGHGSSPVLIATVSSDIRAVLDTNILCPVNYSYRIQANGLNGEPVSSNSDTSIAKPQKEVLRNQKVEIVRSTVIDNQNILVEWKKPIIGPDKVVSYEIYRSSDNNRFSLITTVNSLTHDYIDNAVRVNDETYYYKIETINLCRIKGMDSNKGSSILLKGELTDDNTFHLIWSAYEGWDLGVDYYILEKQNEYGEWEMIKKLDRNTFNHTDY